MGGFGSRIPSDPSKIPVARAVETQRRAKWPKWLFIQKVSQQLPETGVNPGEQLPGTGVSTVCLNSGLTLIRRLCKRAFNAGAHGTHPYQPDHTQGSPGNTSRAYTQTQTEIHCSGSADPASLKLQVTVSRLALSLSVSLALSLSQSQRHGGRGGVGISIFFARLRRANFYTHTVIRTLLQTCALSVLVLRPQPPQNFYALPVGLELDVRLRWAARDLDGLALDVADGLARRGGARGLVYVEHVVEVRGGAVQGNAGVACEVPVRLGGAVDVDEEGDRFSAERRLDVRQHLREWRLQRAEEAVASALHAHGDDVDGALECFVCRRR